MDWGKFILIMTTILSIFLLTFLSFPSFYKTINSINNQIHNFGNPSIQDLPESNNFSGKIQFMENLKFNHNNITYSYQLGCNSRIEKMNLAFQILQDLSENIRFTKVEKNPDIIIICTPGKNTTEKDSLAGEGGPKKIINLSNHSLIIEGEIKLYGEENDCPYPIVELHELLHVFGYDHINNKSDLLYPYYHCDQRISEQTITHLKNLYKEPSKADIVIQNITSQKDGEYLNIEILLKNQGLIPAEKILVSILTLNNQILEEITHPLLDPGKSIQYSITNKKLLKKDIKKIEVLINTSTEEYSKENNLRIVEI